MVVDLPFRHPSGTEWPASLDIAALVSGGWEPAPFQEFIVKIHGRCDLACDYCYMYEMADQSWREKPRAMSVDVAELAAARIGEHARGHGLDRVALIMHGGEPLLAGPHLIRTLVSAVRREVGGSIAVDVSVQTNGTGLTEEFLRLFDELGVGVGVSLDGDGPAHDRHRRFPSGRASYPVVAAGLNRLRTYPHLFRGLLCTVDLRNDPVSTYESLASFEPPQVDFLLPHGTWERPPPGRGTDPGSTPYADWLIAIFQHWYRAPRPRIRLFDEIIALLLGGTAVSEMVGLAPVRTLVIETDGTIEQTDSLKAAFPGAPATGLRLADQALDAALRQPGIAARQLGASGLSAQCQACRVHRVCGGGLYSHRYRAGTGFANPSVYCPDMMRLIDHIRERVRLDLAARTSRKA